MVKSETVARIATSAARGIGAEVATGVKDLGSVDNPAPVVDELAIVVR